MSDTDNVSMDISPNDTSSSPRAELPTSQGKSEDTIPSSPTPAAKAIPNKRGSKVKKETNGDEGAKEKGAKKRGSKAKKEVDGDEDDEDENPEKKAKVRPKATPTKADRQRKTPVKAVAGAHAIARSYDECSEWDKKLIDMRDADRSWPEIRTEWEKLTGDKTGSSTLPNRYNRLKTNFTVIKEEDNGKMLEAKKNVEEAFEKGKWAMIATAMEKLGGDTYKPETLQRQYKKLMLSANATPPAGVTDKDFDIKVDEDE